MSSVAIKIQNASSSKLSSLSSRSTRATTPAARRLALATHVLRTLRVTHDDGRWLDLDALCETLGIENDADDAPASDGVRARRLRREDVRDAVRKLDEEGYVDAARMRLTLAGFTLASAIAERRLLPLR